MDSFVYTVLKSIIHDSEIRAETRRTNVGHQEYKSATACFFGNLKYHYLFFFARQAKPSGGFDGQKRFIAHINRHEKCNLESISQIWF